MGTSKRISIIGLPISLIAVVCLLTFPVMPSAVADEVQDRDTCVIVRFDGRQQAVARAAVSGAGATIVRGLLDDGGVLVDVPDGVDAQAYAAALSRLPGVEYAEPDHVVEPVSIPDDPGYSLQWSYSHIQVPDAWDMVSGDPGVVVAILDTGVDLDHPDLVANLLAGGYDFGDDDSDPNDPDGHGTHVAGIIAAETGNAIGVAGIASGVALLPVKVFPDSGEGYMSSVADAIRYATDAGVDIINMSLGGSYASTYLEEAVEYARSEGVVLVASAGNTYSEGVLYPAACPGVVAVAATTPNDEHADYSSYGAEVDLSAPGTDIYSTIIGAYGTKSGTSMAAPHVTGALALLVSAEPTATTGQLVSALQVTATDLGEPGWDSLTGFGLIQVCDAIDHLEGPYSWDATAPVTVTDASETYVDSATIVLSATDEGGTGVVGTLYSLDGAAEVTGTVVTVSGYGVHTLAYRSVDLAGNQERPQALTLRIVEYLGPDVERLEGPTRYETCIELSKSLYANGGVPTVVIASGEGFADALSASALAGAYGSPLLLTARTALPTAVAAELERLGATHAVIIGGAAAVSDDVLDDLDDLGITAERVAGIDRYETSAAVAREVEAVIPDGLPKTVLVARGDTFPDALALAAIAAGQGMPVLLTRPDVLPESIAGVIQELDAGYVLLAGGTSAVSPTVAEALDDVPGIITVTRVYGSDRYETAAAVASYAVARGWASSSYIGLGTGQNFPDALSGGVVAGAQGGVLLLTRPSELSEPTRGFITLQSEDEVLVQIYGSVSAVSDTVLHEVEALRF